MCKSSIEPIVADISYNFLDPTTPHDAILIVEETKFYVQNNVLSECSELFKKLFEEKLEKGTEDSDKKITAVNFMAFNIIESILQLFLPNYTIPLKKISEKVNKNRKVVEIQLKDVSAEEFNVFLKMIYPGDFEINVSNYLFLAVLSDRFLVKKGVHLCESLAWYFFNEFDIIDMIELAVKYEMPELKKLCSEYIASDEPDDSFISNNKQRILNATEKAKIYLIEQIIKTKY